MNIIAIGGGEKTPAIKHAVELTGDDKPNVLLIPSACSTERSYDSKVSSLSKYFGDLGLQVSRLHEFEQPPSETRLHHEIGAASLLYTIGGNSPHMFSLLREHGSDVLLKKAIFEGKVHAGTSAGALLPFELAHSCVAKRPSEEQWDYAFLEGLGIIPGTATVHADKQDETPAGLRSDTRRDALIHSFPASQQRGYAIDNGAALVFSAKPQVIRSSPASKATLLERSTDGSIQARPIEAHDLQL